MMRLVRWPSGNVRGAFLSFLAPENALLFAQMIAIKEVIERIHAGEIFSCKVVRYDRRRKERTGEIIDIEQCKLVWGNGVIKKKYQGEREPTPLELSLLQAQAGVLKRNPHHSEYYTRNVRIYLDGNPTEIIKKIHPPLIVEFNGQITMV